jgi:hypothetical protein
LATVPVVILDPTLLVKLVSLNIPVDLEYEYTVAVRRFDPFEVESVRIIVLPAIYAKSIPALKSLLFAVLFDISDALVDVNVTDVLYLSPETPVGPVWPVGPV